MDYAKLKKETLIEMCDARGVDYSSSFSKDKLIDLLFNAETTTKPAPWAATQSSQYNYDEYVEAGPDTIGKIGAIFSLIGAGSMLFVQFMLGIVLLAAFFLILGLLSSGAIFAVVMVLIFSLVLLLPGIIAILTFMWVLPYLKGTASSKTKAGVISLFSGGLLGGVFILASDYRSDEDINPTE